MKKSKLFCLVIILLLIVTGCGEVDIGTGKKLNSVLINKKIISMKYKYFDLIKHHHQLFSGGPGTVDNYFIYKDDSSNLIAIKYDYYKKDKYYIANIYDKVTEEVVEEYDCSDDSMKHGDNYYINSNNTCSIDGKYYISYNDGDVIKYKMYQKSFIILKYYKVEKVLD